MPVSVHTMEELLAALETSDARRVQESAKALIHKSFNHLYFTGDGLAMCTMLIALDEILADEEINLMKRLHKEHDPKRSLHAGF